MGAKLKAMEDDWFTNNDVEIFMPLEIPFVMHSP
jgi:hypothetical protein